MNAPQAFEIKEDIAHYIGGQIVLPQGTRFADAYRQGWISAETVQKIASQLSKNSYGQYLSKIVNELNSGPQVISLSTKR